MQGIGVEGGGGGGAEDLPGVTLYVNQNLGSRKHNSGVGL